MDIEVCKMNETIQITPIDRIAIPPRRSRKEKSIDYFKIIKSFLETRAEAGLIHIPYDLKAMFDPHNVNANSLAREHGIFCVMRNGNLYLVKSE